MLLASHCCTTNDQKRKLFTLRFKKYGNVILALVYINKKGYTIRESQIYIKFKICKTKRYFIYKIIRLVNLKFENVFFFQANSDLTSPRKKKSLQIANKFIELVEGNFLPIEIEFVNKLMGHILK